MKTLFDVFSCIIFAGVAVLFLQRSAAATRDRTALWRYLVAALGCAVADVVGNNGYQVAGSVLLVATTAFCLLALNLLPLGRNRTP